MHVWLIKLEEMLPIDQGFRPYRMSLLANALLAKGHKVTRWCSDYNHLEGKSRFGQRTQLILQDNYSVELLFSGVNYRKVTSVMRLLDNYLLYRQFLKEGMATTSIPDLIVCSMPTPELAYASAKISKKFNIPLVVDARDMWPDVLEAELSGVKRLLAFPVIWWMKRKITYAAEKSTSLVGITDYYRDFLISYAGRKGSDMDAVFSIGYEEKHIDFNDERYTRYWNDQGLTFNEEKKIIYFAGRLNSTVDNAIAPVVEAAKMLDQANKNVVFVFCGSGSKSLHISEACSGLENIIFPGEVGSDHLAFLREKSFAAILPIESRVDYLNSLSNKFFEYISSSLPVFSALDGVPGKMLKQNICGFVYDNGNELFNQINLLLEDAVLVKIMKNNAISLFDRDYRAETIYYNFVCHLEKVFENGLKNSHM